MTLLVNVFMFFTFNSLSVFLLELLKRKIYLLLAPCNPSFFCFFPAVSFLHTYGWYILVLAIAGLYIWNKWLKEKYNDWRIEKEEREYDARYHKSEHKRFVFNEFTGIYNAFFFLIFLIILSM